MKEDSVYIAQIIEAVAKIHSFVWSLEIVWNTIQYDLALLEEKLKSL